MLFIFIFVWKELRQKKPELDLWKCKTMILSYLILKTKNNPKQGKTMKIESQTSKSKKIKENLGVFDFKKNSVKREDGEDIVVFKGTLISIQKKIDE